MKTNVSTLLREFPKIRRAALAGEVVIVETREGNLRVTADRDDQPPLVGLLKGVLKSGDDLDRPTTTPDDWGGEAVL